jgi:hypothetical protein
MIMSTKKLVHFVELKTVEGTLMLRISKHEVGHIDIRNILLDQNNQEVILIYTAFLYYVWLLRVSTNRSSQMDNRIKVI